MNAFEEASAVERQALKELTAFFRSRADEGRFIFTGPGFGRADDYTSQFLQRNVGDLIYNSKAGKTISVEVKADKTDCHNFFLETWSNRARGRQRDGWLFTSHADWLAYYFVKRRQLFMVPFGPLWDWAVERGNLYRHPHVEKAQTRYLQPNVTVGVPVPIKAVRDALRSASFTMFRIGDRGDTWTVEDYLAPDECENVDGVPVPVWLLKAT